MMPLPGYGAPETGSSQAPTPPAATVPELPQGGPLLVSLLYQKGRDSRIFQAQDRAIDDFTLKGKPRNGSIDKF
jgi:hypothetical protein